MSTSRTRRAGFCRLVPPAAPLFAPWFSNPRLPRGFGRCGWRLGGRFRWNQSSWSRAGGLRTSGSCSASFGGGAESASVRPLTAPPPSAPQEATAAVQAVPGAGEDAGGGVPGRAPVRAPGGHLRSLRQNQVCGWLRPRLLLLPQPLLRPLWGACLPEGQQGQNCLHSYYCFSCLSKIRIPFLNITFKNTLVTSSVVGPRRVEGTFDTPITARGSAPSDFITHNPSGRGAAHKAGLVSSSALCRPRVDGVSVSAASR